jgi:hypothetical protein
LVADLLIDENGAAVDRRQVILRVGGNEDVGAVEDDLFAKRAIETAAVGEGGREGRSGVPRAALEVEDARRRSGDC